MSGGKPDKKGETKMTYITDIKKIHERNNGDTVPVPHGLVGGFFKGYLLYLCDGKHEGFAFHCNSREEVFHEAERTFDAVPDGFHLYYLSYNGRDPRCPDHIYWALNGEFVK